jgi:hypothetical protein
VRGVARWSCLVGILVWVLAASGCDRQCVVTNPGMCFPMHTCVDGFRRTGSASCEDGEWVCERVACASDAGVCDGACSDGNSD